MSYWTYVNGIITVCPLGRTQHEKRCILETVLDHLPVVAGSEGNLNVYVNQKRGYNGFSSCDEFGEHTNNLVDKNGNRSYYSGWLRTQSDYILVVEGSLRDRMFDRTYKEFQNWLCRLAKRVKVLDILVRIDGYDTSEIIVNKNYVYSNMFEAPSWTNPQSKNWCEYLMWNDQ